MSEVKDLSVTMVCNARLPSKKAHPWQVVQMWEAFEKVGADPQLLYPFRFQRDEVLDACGRKFWTYYDMNEEARSVRLPTVDLFPLLEMLPVFLKSYSRIQQLSFAVASALWFQPDTRKNNVIWSREILALPFFRKWYPQVPLFYEMHRFPGSCVGQQLSYLSKTAGIICLTEGLKAKLMEHLYPEDKILVEADAWSTRLYKKLPPKEEALAKLSLNNNKKKVLYTGHLYRWKGVDSVVEAMRTLPQYEAHLVGGVAEDREALKRRHPQWPSNVLMYEHVPPQEVPYWLAVADVAVVPNSAETLLSREYTSPLKLFEILAAGVPLIASDLPSLREIISEESATLAKADDPKSWTEAIQNVLENSEKVVVKAKIGQQLVAQHTWGKRAERITAFMQEKSIQ